MGVRRITTKLAIVLLIVAVLGSVFFAPARAWAEDQQNTSILEPDENADSAESGNESIEGAAAPDENDGAAAEKPETPAIPEDEGVDTEGAPKDDSAEAKPMVFEIESVSDGDVQSEGNGEDNGDDTPAVTADEAPWQSVYDYTYYRANNTDLQTAFGNDRAAYLNHFKQFGMAEGRRASEAFDPASYRLANRDLRAAFRNDWRSYFTHYLSYGQNEGRVTTGVDTMQNAVTATDGVDYKPVYDFFTYHNSYADLRAAFGEYDDDAYLGHFVAFGMKESRQASASFDPVSYRNAYPDLRAAFDKDWESYYLHYLSYGRREGRTLTKGVSTRIGTVTSWRGVDYSPVYDYAYYYANNADLRKAFGDDDAAFMRHFVTFGMNEGRRASETFDPVSYRLEYQDLRGAYGSNWRAYYQHYLSYGRSEGRVASGVTSLQNPVVKLGGVDYSSVYDFFYYLGKYADLNRAFGPYDDFGALRHFSYCGLLENRQAKANPNAGVYNELRTVVINRQRYAYAQGYSSPTNWLIMVNLGGHYVEVFNGHQGNWGLNRSFACANGAPGTPTVRGVYSVGSRGYSFGHGYTCYYWTQFYGDYLFHSVLYYQNSYRIKDGRLGVAVSHGCVRLAIDNAKWIHDTIPAGTTVVTY